jgi:methylmalonyl-CoA/ethylmalonyl-CoA epimerase
MVANAGAIGSIEHVSVLVRDLNQALEHYTNDLGMGPWGVYTLTPDWIRDMTVHGKEQSYVYKLALCNVGPVLYELMESVQGPSIYEEFLRERGEGVQHLGYFVEDIDAEISKMDSRGFALVLSGRGFGTNDDGAFAHYMASGPNTSSICFVTMGAAQHDEVSSRFGKERGKRGEEQPLGGTGDSSGGDAGSSRGAGAR